MNDLDRWLATGAQHTLDGGPDAPRALYERLKFVAALVKEAGDKQKEPHLLYRDQSRQVQVMPIVNELTIGREKPASLALPDTRLSRTHCTLIRNGDIVEIRDAGSRNGTYVNGQRIESRELRDGDIIEIGGQVLAYVRSKQEEP